MTVFRTVAFACLAVLVTVVPANAQVSLRVLGGMTRTAGESPFVGGSLAGRVGWVEIDVEGGRMFDILPEGLLDRLNELSASRACPCRRLRSCRPRTSSEICA
jgi:hypothetical protein